MTQEDTAGVPVVETIIIPVPAGRASFRGWLVEQSSSRIDFEDERQQRYTVIRLFRVAENSLPGYQFVLSSIGRSVRYHAMDSRCNLGTPVTVGWLEGLDYYEDLVACPRCNAPDIDDMELGEQVRYEMDRINPVIRCTDAAAVKRRLHEPRKQLVWGRDPATGKQARQAVDTMYLSAPAEKLLYNAALKDPDIAAVLEEVHELSEEAE